MIRNKVKMTALVLMLTITSMFVVPKKAEAGIVFVSTPAGVILFMTGLGVGLVSGMEGDGSTLSLIGALGLIVLDADGSLPSEKLVTELSKKYLFIENREVIENIVLKIKEKAGKLNVNEKKYVSFTSSEVDSFLSSMDTVGLDKEIALMKKDFE